MGEETWIARLTPPRGNSLAELLGMSLGLDVWERHTDSLVVVAPESWLRELERRRLARVERLTSTVQYLTQQRDRPSAGAT